MRERQIDRQTETEKEMRIGRKTNSRQTNRQKTGAETKMNERDGGKAPIRGICPDATCGS